MSVTNDLPSATDAERDVIAQDEAEPFVRLRVRLVTVGEGAPTDLEPGTYFAVAPGANVEKIVLHGPYPDKPAALEAAGAFILTAAEAEARALLNQEILS